MDITFSWPDIVHVVVPWLPSLLQTIAKMGPGPPLVIFISASFLMIWRLGALERKGLEGTVLGTVIMPYASGFSNLVFAFIMGRSGGNGVLVLENCIVNNVTNLTLLIGLPTSIWGLDILTRKGQSRSGSGPLKVQRLNRLSLVLTLLAVVFFTGVLWGLSRDEMLNFEDGYVLVGLFLFWQIFQVFDVLKNNIQRGRSLHWNIFLDILLVLASAYVIYYAIESLVSWISMNKSGIFVFSNLGWLSGLLMVVPNTLLAFYYAHARRADIVLSSQVGDGHICIPMCIGLFALFAPINVSVAHDIGMMTIIAICLLQLVFLTLFGRLPRAMGFFSVTIYGYFIYNGLIK